MGIIPFEHKVFVENKLLRLWLIESGYDVTEDSLIDDIKIKLDTHDDSDTPAGNMVSITSGPIAVVSLHDITAIGIYDDGEGQYIELWTVTSDGDETITLNIDVTASIACIFKAPLKNSSGIHYNIRLTPVPNELYVGDSWGVNDIRCATYPIIQLIDEGVFLQSDGIPHGDIFMIPCAGLPPIRIGGYNKLSQASINMLKAKKEMMYNLTHHTSNTKGICPGAVILLDRKMANPTSGFNLGSPFSETTSMYMVQAIDIEDASVQLRQLTGECDCVKYPIVSKMSLIDIYESVSFIFTIPTIIVTNEQIFMTRGGDSYYLTSTPVSDEFQTYLLDIMDNYTPSRFLDPERQHIIDSAYDYFGKAFNIHAQTVLLIMARNRRGAMTYLRFEYDGNEDFRESTADDIEK